jgi:hypothetical protein
MTCNIRIIVLNKMGKKEHFPLDASKIVGICRSNRDIFSTDLTKIKFSTKRLSREVGETVTIKSRPRG